MKGRISFTVAVGIALLAFAAPANATHVACGATLTTDTFLDSDIVCPDEAQTGLVIGADNITIWMNGHTLRGSAVNRDDIGIYSGVAGPDNVGAWNGVTIRGDGKIDGFGFGVLLYGFDHAVRRMTFTGSQADCSGDSQYGILIHGEHGYAYRNVVNMPLCGALNFGVDLAGADSEAWGNTVRGTRGVGVSVSGLRPRAILNTVEDCGLFGIQVAGYGIDGAWASLNTVNGCGEFDAGSVGIIATSGRAEGGNGGFRRNVVTGNYTGMVIDDKSAVVGRNTANQNAATGIEIRSAGTRILNNTANNNGGVGINAVLPDVIDGGGNTATGNGFNGLENCVNVSCGP